MTIIEAINNIDAIKPNTYTQSDKVKWLSSLDRLIKQQLIDTHEQEADTEVSFEGYTDDTPIDTELLVGEPYSDMYIAWLESKIDYTNAEYVRYNNSITRYNDIYQDFVKYYNRTHMPLGSSVKYY